MLLGGLNNMSSKRSVCCTCVCVFGCILSVHIHVRLSVIQNFVDYGFYYFAAKSQLYVGILLKYDYRTEPDQIEGDFELNRTCQKKWLLIKWKWETNYFLLT